MTKTGDKDSGIDAAAWMSDFFEVDSSRHVGSLTAAIARGWSTEMIRDIIVRDSECPCGEWDIEDRLDSEGRKYRISGEMRTLIECLMDEKFIGEDTVKEIFEFAQVAEVEELRKKAAEIGILDRLNKFLSAK